MARQVAHTEFAILFRMQDFLIFDISCILDLPYVSMRLSVYTLLYLLGSHLLCSDSHIGRDDGCLHAHCIM